MNDRYGKRAKGSSPLRNLPLLLVVVLVLIGCVFAAQKKGLLPTGGGEEAAAASSSAPAEPETDMGPAEADAQVSHAPADSVIAPTGKAEDTAVPVQTAQDQSAEPAPGLSASQITPGLPGEGILVCIDPGHGGKDPGCNTEERLEKDDVLALGLAMRAAMEKLGMKVIMTREDDTFIPLDERCEIANKADATYYISVHRNIYGDSSVYGNEIWKSSNASDEASTLADNLMSALEQAGIQKNRGVREGSQDHNGDYAVLRNSKMPSVLLEMGFLQNKKDNKLFDRNMDLYAEKMANAVLDTWEEYHVNLDEDVVNADAS